MSNLNLICLTLSTLILIQPTKDREKIVLFQFRNRLLFIWRIGILSWDEKSSSFNFPLLALSPNPMIILTGLLQILSWSEECITVLSLTNSEQRRKIILCFTGYTLVYTTPYNTIWYPLFCFVLQKYHTDLPSVCVLQKHSDFASNLFQSQLLSKLYFHSWLLLSAFISI